MTAMMKAFSRKSRRRTRRIVPVLATWHTGVQVCFPAGGSVTRWLHVKAEDEIAAEHAAKNVLRERFPQDCMLVGLASYKQ